MVDYLRKTDYEDCAKIWRMSFNDTDEYIKNFFDKMYNDGIGLVYREQGVAVAALYLLEAQTVIKGHGYSTYYLYAAATLPAHRNKGIMSILIEESVDLAKHNGIDFIVVCPAEPGLFDYYGKFGFKTAFYKKAITYSRAELTALSKKADLSGAFNLDVFDTRQTALGLCDFLNWSEKSIKYAMFENAYTKGALAATSDGYALYTMGGKDTMYVTEICTVGDIGELFDILLLEESALTFVLNLPVDSPISSEKEKIIETGMIVALNEKSQQAEEQIKNAYIGLSLG